MSRLVTERLELIPMSLEALESLVAGAYDVAGNLIGVVIPKGWPYDAEAIAGLSWHLRAVQADAAEIPWRIRLIVLRTERRVIGSINLKGPPDDSGTVEIGWGVVEEYRGKGIATEATGAVIKWTMECAKVRRVIATIPENNQASQGVARRVGMSSTSETKRGLPVWALMKGETVKT